MLQTQVMLKIHQGGSHQHKRELTQKLTTDIAKIKESVILSKMEREEKINKLRATYIQAIKNIENNLY